MAKPASARADSMAGRITALDRSLACTKCAGKGFLVVRTRQSRGAFREPIISESFDDCPMCHGLGHTPTSRRISLPLDGVAGALAGIPMDLPTAPTLIERARKALVRVGATGEFAVAITAADTTHGTWWYTVDGGTNWSAMGSVSDASARVLNADSRRLFVETLEAIRTNFQALYRKAFGGGGWSRRCGPGSAGNAHVWDEGWGGCCGNSFIGY